MSTKKMSLANIQGKLTRNEMKNIMAGSGNPPGCLNDCVGPCVFNGSLTGICATTTAGCQCFAYPG